jgi:RHS repeat-associated protein
VTTNYVWDVGSALPVVLQETAGGQTTYYVYGLDLIASIEGSTPTYYLTDGLGSTSQLANNAGTVTGSYSYDVFGSVRTHTGAGTEWTYTGEQNDPNGLEYLRARYYDPAVGRFLSRDQWPGSVLSPASLNPYAYVLNSPLNWIDPWGLCNVEGTPTPTPSSQYLVCRAVLGRNPGCQYIVPSIGWPSWSEISMAIQVADVLPIGSLPIWGQVVGEIADISAVVAAEIDIVRSECSLENKVGLSLNNAGNLTVGTVGNVFAAPDWLVSGAEGSMLAGTTGALETCGR